MSYHREHTMRILHTVDWHLGRIFYGRHLTDDQRYIMENQFFHLLTEMKIDAVVIAGDIYDRAVPPVEAVALWDEVITKLGTEYHIPTFVVGGNHDSGERLGFGRTLLAKTDIHIEGFVRKGMVPIPLDDAFGTVWFCPIPFAYPTEMMQSLPLSITHTADGDHEVSSEEWGDTTFALRAWRDEYLRHIPNGHRSIGIAHAFVTGGLASESERPLSIGGSEYVDKEAFTGFNYTALGHLHKPQKLGSDRIRYSGSLLKYSFDEAHHKKSFTVIDIDEKGKIEISLIPITPHRDVRILEGSFQSLLEGAAYKRQMEQGVSMEDYILAKLTDEAPVIDGLARLRKVYPNVLALDLVGRMTPTGTGDVKIYNKLNERELFNQFAQAAWKDGLTKEQKAYVDTVWKEAIEES